MAITIDPKLVFGKIKQPKVWGTTVMVVLLIGGIVWWWVARENRIRDGYLSRDREIVKLKYELIECRNAPADTVWVDLPIMLGPTALVKPQPIKVLGPPIKDPSMIDNADTIEPCPRNYYNDTIIQENYSINYEALGCLRKFRVLKIDALAKMPVITQKEFIAIHDTAWLPYKPKPMRWGVGINANVGSFIEFPGGGVEVFGIIQDKIIIGIGPQYYNGAFVQARISYIIK